jgi:hypothetical protein
MHRQHAYDRRVHKANWKREARRYTGGRFGESGSVAEIPANKGTEAWDDHGLWDDKVDVAWAQRDTCRFCDYRMRKKQANAKMEADKGLKSKPVYTDRIVDEMCACNKTSLGKYTHDEKSDHYTDRFASEGGPENDETVRFARAMFKILLKEAMQRDTFKTKSFVRMRAAVDTLAPFLDEKQKQTVRGIFVDAEAGFSRAVQFVLHKNLSPGDKRERLTTPKLWFDAISHCIGLLRLGDLVVTDVLRKVLTEGVKCDKSCASPCKKIDGRCSYESYPLIKYLQPDESLHTTNPWRLKGCGLSALTRDMQERKAERKDEDIAFEQEMLICEDSARKRSKAYAKATEVQETEQKQRPEDRPSPVLIRDTCELCRDLREAGVISVGNLHAMCSKAICEQPDTHAALIVRPANTVYEPNIQFARGIFMEFVTEILFWPALGTNVHRSGLRTANIHSMRAGISRASPYMDAHDASKAHELVNSAELETAKFVRMVMHTNKNGEERLLSPAAWCKAIVTLIGYFNECETTIAKLIRSSVIKEKRAAACKPSASGVCEAPCVEAKSALPFKMRPGKVTCVHNKMLVDDIKADPAGFWSTRGCGLDLFRPPLPAV